MTSTTRGAASASGALWVVAADGTGRGSVTLQEGPGGSTLTIQGTALPPGEHELTFNYTVGVVPDNVKRNSPPQLAKATSTQLIDALNVRFCWLGDHFTP